MKQKNEEQKECSKRAAVEVDKPLHINGGMRE